MYPEITPQIRKAIKRRYEIMPYIYSLGLDSHLTASPPQRWIGWGCESDPEVWTKPLKNGEEQFWFGDTLLIGGVYQPGADTARIYLPRRSDDGFDYGYVNLNAPYDYHASGQWINVLSPWRESIPIFAKIGGAIPVGKSVHTRMPGDTKPQCASLPEDDYRGIEMFPPKGSSHGKTFDTTWYEDDGLALHPDISSFTVSYSSTEEKVTVSITPDPENVFIPPWREVELILPQGDQRYIEAANGSTMERVDSPDSERIRYRSHIAGYKGMDHRDLCNGHH